MQKVTIYTDGASRGNPGPGGWGALLCYEDAQGDLHTKELSEGYKNTTNNRMELLGVINALEALKHPCQVEIHSDSKYVVDAFQKDWICAWQAHGWRTASKKPVKNVDLWQRLLRAAEPHEVSFVWVKGHAGNDYNERCDDLAVAAATQEQSQLKDDVDTSVLL